LMKLAKPFLKNQYGKYLMTLTSENNWKPSDLFLFNFIV
jgi:hypothetical protein